MKTQKFRNAAEKQKAEENKKSWDALLKKYPPAKIAPSKEWSYNLRIPPGRNADRIPSKGGETGIAAKKESPVYTGTEMIGIATMHKSNMVPVFKKSEAQEISNMRR